MKKILLGVLTTTFFLLAACGGEPAIVEEMPVPPSFEDAPVPSSIVEAPASPVPDPGVEEATQVRAVDGDTTEVTRDGVREKVRVLVIDTRERGQCGYEEAREFVTSEIPPGAPVFLTKDVSQDAPSEDRDRYGRLLRYVDYLTPDGQVRDLSIASARAGWAEVYERYPVSKTPEVQGAVDLAQQERLGIWGDEALLRCSVKE